MTDDHDQIDTWLERDITPLMPRQGSLDRIRRTARRRKTTQAVMAAAGCAVIIAAAAVIPQLAHSPGNPRNTAAASNGTTSAGPSPTGAPSAAPSTTQPASPRPRSSPSTSRESSNLIAGAQVPAIFHPTSVTFVGNQKGGVIGAVIGQGRNKGPTPCATQYCTSLAATPNYGRSWHGVSAPLTGPPARGTTGVSQLRFANLSDGWAYGPALFQTTDGGANWSGETTFGQRIVALEAGAGQAFAIFAQCTSTTADFAQGCTSFALYTSADGSATWRPAAVPRRFAAMHSTAPSSASLTIAGNLGYVLGPSGQLLRGNLTSGTWTYAGLAKCLPGGAQASGLPLDAHLATLGALQATQPLLVLACNGTSGGGPVATIYTSSNGRTWSRTGTASTAGQATSLAGDEAGHLVLATTGGLYYSGNQGMTWYATHLTGSEPKGGFSYVGMTTSSFGVAVPADAGLGEIFVTSDGGLTWVPSRISG